MTSICLLLFKFMREALFDTTSVCCMCCFLCFEFLCTIHGILQSLRGEPQNSFIRELFGEVLLGNLSIPRKLFFFIFFFLMRHAQYYCSETEICVTAEQERCDKPPNLMIFRHCKAIPYTFAMGLSC